MHRIDGPDAVQIRPDAPPAVTLPGYFSGGNPAAAKRATRVTAHWLNTVQEELIGVIAGAGLSLSRTKSNQLLEAIRRHVLAGLLDVCLCTQQEYDCIGPSARTDGRVYVIIAGEAPDWKILQIKCGDETYKLSGGGGATLDINWDVEMPGYPSQFMDFMERTPFKGWRVRNGAVLEDADVNFPELWYFLQAPAHAWKLKTQAQWTALSNAAGGVGGAPFFVLDEEAKTIRLPDTRGDYTRGAGGGTMAAVGDWHKDAIRNITGYTGTLVSRSVDGEGGVFWRRFSENCINAKSSNCTAFWVYFDASRVVPTANENRTRTFGLLPCVYVGGE